MSTRKNAKKTRSQRSRPEPEIEEIGIGKAMIWLALVAVWVFLAGSLVSFNAGDAPSHVVWPHNDPAANWCGPIGATVSYHLLKVLGWGVAVPMAFAGAALVLSLMRRSYGQPIIRAVGVLMLTTAVASMAAVLLPQSGPMPHLAGGTLGVVLAAEMLPRFSTAGTMLWLVLLLSVGLLVTLDQLLWRVPAMLWDAMIPTASRTRAVAGSAAGATAKASGGLIVGLGSMLRGRKPVSIRLDDLDDEPVEIDARTGKRKRRIQLQPAGQLAVEEEEPEVEYEDDDDVEYEDEYDEEYEDEYEAEGEYDDEEYEDDEEPEYVDADEEDAADEEYEEEEEAEAPGAPQVFDQDRLRDKIAKLPVRFAAQDRQVATEDDMASLQNLVEMEGYRFPGLDLLEQPEENFTEKLEQCVREQAESLEAALQQYRIDGEVVDIESGPVITLYHVRLAPGTKVAQLNAISSDLARALRAVNIRIVSNMAGRDTVGVEVPNPTKEKVRLKELMGRSDRFDSMRLPMFLGKDASGDPLIADLTKMPHMLIAGTTGSGKSVCMNTIIMSFLYTRKPNELKLVLVDPKMVEMSQFKEIPHLMCPVVTEMPRAAAILEWACGKMDERYELLAEAGVRDISAYNELEWDELKERMGVTTEQEEARIPRRLPYMVFIIDELADLMMTAKEVEGSIIRIAQKARAVGIHLILATQRPQANVVTGLIKSNMPCRVSFKVASGMDSRIVLDQKGGELLLGQGDMLFLSPSSHKLTRAQGTLVDDREIRRVVRFMRDVAAPTFERSLVQLRSGDADEERIYESENNSSASLQAAQEDPMFDRAVEIVLETKRGSVSLLQRRLAIGYTRASRLIDLMGIAGIISEHKGSVARDVLISEAEWQAMKELHERELAGDNETLFEDGEPGPDGGPDGTAVGEQGPEVLDAAKPDVVDETIEDEAEAETEVVDEEEEDPDAEYVDEEEEDPDAEYVDEEEEDPDAEYVDEEEEDPDAEYVDEEEEDPDAEYVDEEEEDPDAEYVDEEEEDPDAEYVDEEEEDPDAEYVDEEEEDSDAEYVDEEEEDSDAEYVDEEEEDPDAEYVDEEEEDPDAEYVDEEEEDPDAEYVDEEEEPEVEFLADEAEEYEADEPVRRRGSAA